MNKKRIAFLIYSLSGGGAERVTCHLAERWASQNIDVTVLTYSSIKDNRYKLSKKVNLVSLDIADESKGVFDAVRRNINRLFVVRSKVVELDVDCVISMMAASNVLLALSCVGLDVKLIGAERNYPGDDNANFAWRILRKYSYRWLDSVVVQTEEGKRWLEDNTWVKKISVIPNPVVFPLPSFDPIVSAQEFESKKLIIGVGRLIHKKQFHHLINAFSEISGGYPDWCLVILGEGMLRTQLEECINVSNNCNGRVKLLGRVGNVADWYGLAKIFVLCSNSEGYPNALIEAMAYRTAVISYDCKTGPSEIIDNQINGLLIEEGSIGELVDGLKLLMENERLRDRLSEKAVKIREKLSLDTISDAWVEILY